MQLWLLKPHPYLEDDPWDPWFDKAFGFVVRAPTEEDARMLATSEGGDETYGGKYPWMDNKYSSCCQLTEGGDIGVIIRDFAGA